jgi:hypothetical protein
MPRKIILPFLCIILAACTTKPTLVPTTSVQQKDIEEQAVYTAVLLKLYNASNYVIMDTTGTSLTGTQETNSTLNHVLLIMHGVATETADSFQTRNDMGYPLRSDMAIGTGYVLLSQKEKSQLFNQNQDGWQLFYEHYPDTPGITALSRVGFNQSLDQALVYVGTQSQWLAGSGYYILLKKVNGIWIVDQQVMTWVS